MPASSSPQISKVTARRAIERITEVRNGMVDMASSVAGYCNDGGSSSYGKVWALLSTQNGPVQYSGYSDDLRRTRPPTGSISDKSAEMIISKMSEGFQDIDSGTLKMRPWSTLDAQDASYRGKKCAAKKRGPCMRSKTCSYRKGVYARSGKQMRVPSCAKKASRRRRSRKSSKCRSRSGKKMRRVRRSPCRSSLSSKKSKKSSKRCRRSRSGKKMRRVSAASLLGKKVCAKTDDCTWVTGKKGSRVGYCRKINKTRRKCRRRSSSKRMRRVSRSSSKMTNSRKSSKRRRRSGKKMRRVSKCNTLKSGKKRSRKACKKSMKCSWKRGSKVRKGYCARK